MSQTQPCYGRSTSAEEESFIQIREEPFFPIDIFLLFIFLHCLQETFLIFKIKIGVYATPRPVISREMRQIALIGERVVCGKMSAWGILTIPQGRTNRTFEYLNKEKYSTTEVVAQSNRKLRFRE